VGAVGSVVADGTTGRVVTSRDPSVLAAAVTEAVTRGHEWGPAAAARVRRTSDIGAVADRWADLLAGVALSRAPRR